jgi:hypothetical protein
MNRILGLSILCLAAATSNINGQTKDSGFNPIKRTYLTKEVNPFFVRTHFISSVCSGYIKEMAGKIADQSVLVAGIVPIVIGIEPMSAAADMSPTNFVQYMISIGSA